MYGMRTVDALVRGEASRPRCQSR